MSDPNAAPRSRAPLVALGLGALACAVVATFVWLDYRGPRDRSAEPPEVAMRVTRAPGGETLARNAYVSPSDILAVQVRVPRSARVSVVHLNLGHGMEPVALNLPLGAERPQENLTLELEGLDGPQVVVAVSAERELIPDEALSAARGVPVAGTRVTRFEFSVGLGTGNGRRGTGNGAK